MLDIDAEYLEEVRSSLHLLGTWPPDRPRLLGDVGRMVGPYFEFDFNLASRGITFGSRTARSKGRWRFASKTGASVSLKTKGAIPSAGSSLPVEKAGITIQFSRSGALYFAADECWVEEVEDSQSLGAELLTLLRASAWNAEHFVVTEVVHTTGATLLISGSTSASSELSLDLDEPAGLATASLGATMVSGKDISGEFLSHGETTPFFRTRSLKRRPFNTEFRGQHEGPTDEARYLDLDQPGDPAI